MMKDFLISMYIDNELGLDEKIDFAETVHADKHFKNETISLLQQEKVIRSQVVEREPSVYVPQRPKLKTAFWRPIGIFAGGLAAAAVIFFLILPPAEKLFTPHRFVIYKPDVSFVEVAGSFTEWRTLPMKRVGDSGYWEVTLNLPEGEHRFSYILEGNRRLSDPTIMARELDDFGGENSILEVKLQT